MRGEQFQSRVPVTGEHKRPQKGKWSSLGPSESALGGPPVHCIFSTCFYHTNLKWFVIKSRYSPVQREEQKRKTNEEAEPKPRAGVITGAEDEPSACADLPGR